MLNPSALRLIVSNPAQKPLRLFQRDDVGIFGMQIKQALFVSGDRTIADGFAYDNWPEPVLNRIDGGRAHAAAGRATRNDQGIDATAVEP